MSAVENDQPRMVAMAKLRGLEHQGDVEMAHADADQALCDLLRALGYNSVVDAWERVPKWYA